MGWGYSGNVFEGSLNVDSDGYGWSSTSSLSVSAYGLGYGSDSWLGPSNGSYRRRGIPIRCTHKSSGKLLLF